MKTNQNRLKEYMKTFITIFISCSLAFAASAIAQQDEGSPAPKKKQHGKPQTNQETAAPAKPQAAPPGHPAHHQEAAHHQEPGMKQQGHPPQHPKPETPATEPAQANPNGNANPQAEHHKQAHPAHQQAAAATNETTNPSKPAHEKAAAKSTETETTSSQANPPNAQTNKHTAQANKADIQAIKAQHANFHAQQKSEIPAVTFNQSRTISGSQNWQGQNYTVFRSYHPAIHDRSWYHSHYNRIELIGGGYYFFNGGYWYPAWGYEPSAQYYVYDGPIYAGRQAEPPDQVIADVQGALQEMGYYKGEVDGLLGPLTREALTGYQADNGLYTTAAIDQPTLDSLGI